MLLDSLRKHSRSFIIYVLFGIIIAVFVVNFGPQAKGCAASTSFAARVEGRQISHKLFAYAQSITRIRSRQFPEPQMIQLRGMVMDRLLARDLLAEDAINLGIRIPEKSIDDMFFKGRFLALGQPQSLRDKEDDWQFDYNNFSRMVKYLWQLTVKKFKEEQRQELLAEKMRQLLRASVKVSEDEVKADYAHKKTQIALHYVRFSPTEFLSQVQAQPAEINAFTVENKKKIKDYYEENKTAFSKLPKQVRLRVIQINKAADAKAKADAALRRIQGGEAFHKIASEVSEDPKSRAIGGLLSWRNEDSPGIGKKAQSVIAKLAAGKVSQVIEEEDKLLIVKIVNRREGDLTLAQAQNDIAEEMILNQKAIALAKKTAEEFIKRVESGEKLTTLFADDDDSDKSDKSDESDKKDSKDDKEAEKEKTAQKPAVGPKLKLQSTATFPRSSRNLIPGIGISKNLTAAIFKLKEGEVAKKPFVIDKMVYLVAAKEKTTPDWKEWKKRKEDIVEEYQTQKWLQAMKDYSYKRCQKAFKDKRLSVNNRALITPGYVHPKDKPPLPTYEPCSSLKSTRARSLMPYMM